MTQKVRATVAILSSSTQLFGHLFYQTELQLHISNALHTEDRY